MNLSKLFKKTKIDIVRFNLIFVFIFLNIWDVIISRQLFNAMVLGVVMLAPVTILWTIKSFKASMLATMYAIFLSSVLSVFFVEGFEPGTGWFIKISFWLPYLAVSIINAFWGLRIYSRYKSKLKRSFNESTGMV